MATYRSVYCVVGDSQHEFFLLIINLFITGMASPAPRLNPRRVVPHGTWQLADKLSAIGGPTSSCLSLEVLTRRSAHIISSRKPYQQLPITGSVDTAIRTYYSFQKAVPAAAYHWKC